MKVIAYHVTARRARDPRGFRRVGRWFPVGQPVRVDVAALSTEQAAFLKGSDPRDLVVVEEIEQVALPAPAPVAVEPAGIGTSPSDPEPPAAPAVGKKGRGK